MKWNVIYAELTRFNKFLLSRKSSFKIFDTMRDKFREKWRITWLPNQF